MSSDDSDETVAHGRPKRDSGRTEVTSSPTETMHTELILDEIRRGALGRMVLQDEVAEGGMGRIDEVFDRALARRVAKKTIHGELMAEQRTLAMFLREARINGQLEHPNIVPVYDIGAQTVAGEETLYFTMKMVNGQTLRALIRELPDGAIDPPVLFTLLDAVTRVCDALSFAHSRGVLHCDVKAENVMVGDFGQVYLMDWGIARPLEEAGSEESETAGAVIGSASYMSPEQARGLRHLLDARSDVFLMGALLYEIVTRRPPYRSRQYEETLKLAAAARYDEPSKVVGVGVVPTELERIILKAMAPDPEHRYRDTDELKNDLVRFMRGGAEFPRTTFKAGTTIVREGERGNTAYIIVTGRCEVRKNLDRTFTVLQTLGPGDVFGEMAVLNETTRSATVTAIEDTTALVVSGDQLLREMATLKPWMASIMQRLASRLQDMYATRRVQTFVQSVPARRLATQIYMHLLAFGQHEADGRLHGVWSVVAKSIEDQLGVPATTIGVVMARYEGLLNVDSQNDVIEIPRPGELARRLRSDD